MADYALLTSKFGSEHSHILRRHDAAVIPSDPRNADYMAYLAWVEAGNVADPLPPTLNGEDETFNGDPWKNMGSATKGLL